ncbi:MAG: hypothetical protein LBC18_08375 [Opitutaceae bacterium]|jgi:hypothetical protein|nr:hypothetical protein [Opitutaceae bacterium]
MSTAPFTNHTISATHLANFRAALKDVASEAQLKSLAEKHSLFFLSKDAAEARTLLAQALRRVRSHA